jgi:hypothetical protein
VFRKYLRREIPEPAPLPASGTCNYCSTITGIHVKIGKFQVWSCAKHTDLALDTFNEMRAARGHH